MILYIASYPRSGNSWVGQIIQRRLHIITTDIHQEVNPTEYPKEPDYHYFAEGFEFLGFEHADHGLIFERYCYHDCPKAPNYRLAPKGPEVLKSLEARQYLAKNENIFVVKTHERPFGSYLEGEYVVQPVRHPGASLWSYHHFLKNVIGLDYSQEQVIEGFGHIDNWSQYHTSWDQAAISNEQRFMRVKYEQLFDGVDAFSNSLSTLIGSPIVSDEILPFSYYHKMAPMLARKGSSDAWERELNHHQLTLLHDHHHAVMSRYDYRMPDFWEKDTPD